MRLRITKVDEYQLLTCVKHDLWGSHTARFGQWKPGDLLAVIVEGKLAALGRVEGKPFKSDLVVWDNGRFPHRIKVVFDHFLETGSRPAVLGGIRDMLTAKWGPKYGWGILNQQLLEGQDAEMVVSAIAQQPNSIASVRETLPGLLEAAKVQRSASAKKRARHLPAGAAKGALKLHSDGAVNLMLREEPPVSAGESSLHTKAQSEIVQLGQIVGCSVWVAANDQNRMHRGKPLAEGCVKSLPRMGLSEEAARRISLIDVLWLQKNAPIAAFEIEASTSVYSGLLRMADLLAVVPALNIKIFIVAPESRRDKVMSELGRPIFRKIGLDDSCRYISTETLTKLVEKAKDFGGHMQPSILDSVAEALEDEEQSDL